jgi:histidyl-tRNA synthetase
MTEKKSSKKEAAPKKKEAPTTLKGMRDMTGEMMHKYQGFSEKAAEICLYYGFSPIDTPILEREEVFTSGISDDTDIVGKEMYTLKTKTNDKLALRPEGTAPVMRSYIQDGMQSLPQPVKLYYYGSFFRHEKPQRGRYREFKQFGVEILGSPKSMSDAMIIHLVMTILKEVGCQNLSVEINSIGCRECRPAYVRELTQYYRKHIARLCGNCKQRIKSNPLRLLDCKDAQCLPLKAAAPESVSALCIPCKQHFKEVLEYLTSLDISYRINNNLVRGIDYYTHTVFEVLEEVPTDETTEGGEKKRTPLAIAGGGRYDYLARALGSKKDVPAVGASIGVDRVIALPTYNAPMPKIIKKSKIYFIQLGFEAKLRSLEVIEILRKARIPVLHSLNKDSLSIQLGNAERLGLPYSLILGQKEALDRTVIIRNMENRSQETVKISDLAEYIKEHKIG